MSEAALLPLNKDKTVIIPLDGLLSSFTQWKMWREEWEKQDSLHYGLYESGWGWNNLSLQGRYKFWVSVRYRT